MRYIIIALIALCTTILSLAEASVFPFQDKDHPERCYLRLGTPPLACMGPKAHFKIYYFDDERNIEAMFKVTAVRIDEKGLYFNKADILKEDKSKEKKSKSKKLFPRYRHKPLSMEISTR